MLRLAALCLTLLITACTSAKVSLRPDFDRSLSKVALLPAKAGDGIQRESVNYLHAAVENELRNHGFVVIDSAVVRRVCSSTECPERELLAKRYGAEGLFLLSIESVSRNSFLAGFVNVISGTLTLTNPAGVELATLSQDESERGGLLFNSGQIFQGIISQAKNGDPESFNRLGDKFAKDLVGGLPEIESGTKAQPAAAELLLEDPRVSPQAPGVYQICARGAPGNMAYLLFPGQRSSLREVRAGTYCGIYRLYSTANLSLELRSPFGEVARRALVLQDAGTCDISGKAKLVRAGDKNRIELQCVQLDDTLPLQSCAEKTAVCKASRFLVYRARAATGPFAKIAEFMRNFWIDEKNKDGIYQLVAVNAAGVRSNPVQVPGE